MCRYAKNACAWMLVLPHKVVTKYGACMNANLVHMVTQNLLGLHPSVKWLEKAKEYTHRLQGLAAQVLSHFAEHHLHAIQAWLLASLC